MNSKLFSALSYFSILFFPVLIPLIIYMTNEQDDVKRHAKRAGISQCIPIMLFAVNMFIIPTVLFPSNTSTEHLFSFRLSAWQYMPLILSFAYTIVYFIILLWNLFQGVRVLK